MSRSLLSAALSIIGGKVGIMLIGALLTPILVRLLGPSEYGRYAVVLSIFAFANIFLTSGTNDAVRKFISEKSNEEWQNAIFGYLSRPAIVLAIIVGTAFFLGAASGLVEQVFGREYVSLFYLLTLFSFGRQSREFLMRTLMGLQAENYSEPLRVFQKASFSGLAITAAYLGYSVEGVLVADILTSILVTTIAAATLSQFLDLRSLLRAPSVEIPTKSLYPYIGNTILFFGFLTTLYHVDILFLQYWTTEQTVGYYKGALVIAEMLWFAPAAIQLAILQRVSKLWTEDNVETIQELAEQVTRYALLFTILVAVGMAALAHDFVPLYLGEDFRPAITPLLLLLPGVIGFASARPTIAINQARRSIRPLILATAACSMVNLGLNILLVPLYGMVGAAIATSLGYASLAGFQALAARYVGYAPFAGLPIGRIVATGSISLISIFGLAGLIESSLVSLVVVPPVGFAVFLITAILTGAITDDEVDYVVKLARERFGNTLGW